MALELTVQHPDFSYDELGEFTGDEVRQRIVDHNWDDEREVFIHQAADTGRACPPSVYASKSDDYCLHVYTTDRDGFEAAVLLPRPHKLFGLLKLSATSSVIRAADTLDGLMPVVDAFLANDAQSMMDMLDREVV